MSDKIPIRAHKLITVSERNLQNAATRLLPKHNRLVSTEVEYLRRVLGDKATQVAYELPATRWWSRRGKWIRIHDFWRDMAKVRRPISRLRRDVSFDEYLRSRRDLSPRMCELAWTFVEGYHAAHADRMSAKS